MSGIGSGSASAARGDGGEREAVASAHGPIGDRSGERTPGALAGVVFTALVLASFAAFAVTQRLKHSPTAVQNFEMTEAFYPTRTPAAACRGRVPRRSILASKRIEYLSFKLARADAVTVAIVDAAGEQVAGIVRDLPVERYKQLSLCWNGRRGAHERGPRAAPGEYRVRVSLRAQGLTRYSPRSFTLAATRNGGGAR